jgi:predicted transcriptional regulator
MNRMIAPQRPKPTRVAAGARSGGQCGLPSCPATNARRAVPGRPCSWASLGRVAGLGRRFSEKWADLRYFAQAMKVAPIRLPTELVARIDELAKANGVSRGEEVRQLLEYAIAAGPEEAQGTIGMRVNIKARLMELERTNQFRRSVGLPQISLEQELRTIRNILALEREQNFETYLEQHRALYNRVIRRELHRAGTMQPGWIYGWSILLRIRRMFWKRFKRG